MQDQQLAVALARLESLTNDMADVKSAMGKLTEAVTKLAVVEERQATDREAVGRAFSEIAKLQGRMTALELAQPIQKQSSDLVQKLVSLLLAAVVGAGVARVTAWTEPRTPAAQHMTQKADGQ
jgi:DNA repair exonuclease SbcCD ATPase subunit